MINWDAAGAIGEMLGAAAVFVSLIYLAIQTRQNTRALRSAAFQQVRDSFANVSMVMAQDPQLALLLGKAASGEQLSDTERAQCNYMYTTLVRKGESAYFQSSDGTLQRESWLAIRNTLVGALSSDHGFAWLENSKIRFTKEYIEDLIQATANNRST
jgi:hypothetical protein